MKEPGGTWIARPRAKDDAFALLERVGRVPLPPYIRKGKMVEGDREHYQTVYAQVPGAGGGRDGRSALHHNPARTPGRARASSFAP